MSTQPQALPLTWQQWAEEQDGVVSRRQARLGGLSEDQWQWRLDTGRWRRVLPGVVVTHSGEVTDRQRAWSAVLYAGPGARLSGDAALVELGLRLDRPAVVDVVTSGERTGRRFEQDLGRLAPHRAGRIDAWAHPARRPAVLRAAPAVLHAAAWAACDRAGEWRLAAAVQQRLVRPSDLRAALREMPRLRRRRLLATVLDDVELGAHAASELDFLRFLRRHALPAPDRLQRPVRAGTVRYLDAWWERQRVTAEVDGAHHRTVVEWDLDVLRANDVQVAERHDRVVLLRFSRGNLRHDAERAAAQLRAVL